MAYRVYLDNGILSLLLIVFPLAALGDMRPAAKRGFRLMKDGKIKKDGNV